MSNSWCGNLLELGGKFTTEQAEELIEKLKEAFGDAPDDLKALLKNVYVETETLQLHIDEAYESSLTEFLDWLMKNKRPFSFHTYGDGGDVHEHLRIWEPGMAQPEYQATSEMMQIIVAADLERELNTLHVTIDDKLKAVAGLLPRKEPKFEPFEIV